MIDNSKLPPSYLPNPLHACLSTTEAAKFDGEKVRLDLLPFESIKAIGDVLTFGAKKYDAHNWRKGMSWSRLIGAALRHIFAWATGQDKDSESGLSHLAHAMCCLAFLFSYQQLGAGTDDRYNTRQADVSNGSQS